MKANELVAYGLIGSMLVLVFVDVFSQFTAKPIHFATIGSIVTVILGRGRIRDIQISINDSPIPIEDEDEENDAEEKSNRESEKGDVK